MDTLLLVIVGAFHFFSRTTLRPRGPRVTFTASARVFRPRSSPRRASSSNAIILAIVAYGPFGTILRKCNRQTAPATDEWSGVASGQQPFQLSLSEVFSTLHALRTLPGAS